MSQVCTFQHAGDIAVFAQDSATCLVTMARMVPDTVWAAVIASAITIFGVWMSNRGMQALQIKQLRHEAEENVIERTAVLRRDVSLKAVSSLVRANSFVSSMAMPGVNIFGSPDASKPLVDFLAASIELQLVGEAKTTLLMNALSAEFGQAFMKLVHRLIPLSEARNEQFEVEQSRNAAFAERARIHDEYLTLCRTNAVTEERLKALVDRQEKNAADITVNRPGFQGGSNS